MTVTPDISVGTGIRRGALHGSLADPLLDTVGFLNEVTMRHPDAISFAPGRPFDGFFEVDDVLDALRGYLDHLAEQGRTPEQVRTELFQYGPTAGSIRGIIADALRLDEGIDVAPESIVVTAGAQEAMLLVLRALMADRDDVLLVPSPCYVGITGAARILDVEVRTVADGPEGLRCDDVEAAVLAARAQGRRPRALYLGPDHSNPLGATLSAATREDLLALAERLDIHLIEDSPYRLVSAGEQLATLKAIDRARRVVHIGSFSKTLFPAARVGYAVADQVVVGDDGTVTLLADELTKIKGMVTVNTPSLSQAVVAGMLLAAGGGAAARSTAISAYYGESLAAVLAELERALPPERRAELGVHWNRPAGGFFLAVTVPFAADEAALERSARDFGVLWTPMSYFYPDGGGHHALRLAISHLTGDDIPVGVARLARFIEAEARR